MMTTKFKMRSTPSADREMKEPGNEVAPRASAQMRSSPFSRGQKSRNLRAETFGWAASPGSSGVGLGWVVNAIPSWASPDLSCPRPASLRPLCHRRLHSRRTLRRSLRRGRRCTACRWGSRRAERAGRTKATPRSAGLSRFPGENGSGWHTQLASMNLFNNIPRARRGYERHGRTVYCGLVVAQPIRMLRWWYPR